MKKIVTIILLISTMLLLLPACSLLDEGIRMPSVNIGYTIENNQYLIIDDLLINKMDGSVRYLRINRDIPIPLVEHFYSESKNIYKYEFEETQIKQYIFIKAYTKKSGSSPYYFEYIISFDYDGNEVDRSCLNARLTEKEMQTEFKNKSQEAECFCFLVHNPGAGKIYGRFGLIDNEDASREGQIVLDSAENIHKAHSNNDFYMTWGIAKPMGSELWFSTAGSGRRSFRADYLISGISKTEITSYDLETKELKIIFEHNKKKSQIIDFDENGAYILDSKSNFYYVDFASKKQTGIYEFPNVSCITNTDKYICIEYVRNGRSYFIYEKGGSVVANDSTLD